jgi:Co/Zn/Cd efflux system component
MEHTEQHSHDEHNTLTKRKIWQTFFILLVITILDFVVYFAMNKRT